MLSDLSPSMSPGWQAIDMAIRAIKTALRSVDFQEMPAVVAVVQSCQNTLAELQSHYISGTTTGSAPKTGGDSANDGAQPSSDADSQPPAGSPDEGSSGE
jgi:hypothetical protein